MQNVYSWDTVSVDKVAFQVVLNLFDVYMNSRYKPWQLKILEELWRLLDTRLSSPNLFRAVGRSKIRQNEISWLSDPIEVFRQFSFRFDLFLELK